MHQPRAHPERLQSAHTADPEHGILGEARVPVSDVQLRGDPPVDGVIVLAVVSSRYSGTRPTSMRQIWMCTVRRGAPHRWSAVLVGAGDETAGIRSKSVLIQYSCCQPARSSR